MGTVSDFIFLGSKITADGDCSHEIKRCLLLGRKFMTNLDSILKSWDITWSTKPSQGYGFSGSHVWMWELGYKEAECRRIDTFGLWCWRRLLRVPCTARRSNQSTLKGINPEYSLEGWCWSWNSNTLATWCKELSHLKRPWCWEILKAGGEGDDRGWDGWIVSPTWWTWVWASSGSWWRTGKPGVLHSMGSQRVGHDWVTELNWIEISFQVWNSLYSLNFAWDPGWGDKFESLTSYLHASWVHNKVLFFLKSLCHYYWLLCLPGSESLMLISAF